MQFRRLHGIFQVIHGQITDKSISVRKTSNFYKQKTACFKRNKLFSVELVT